MTLNVLKGGLPQLTIKGADLSGICHVIRIYSSMCSPYRKAEITLLNKDNLVTKLELQTGDPVSFTVQDNEGKTYSMSGGITAIPTEMNEEKLREETIMVAMATPAFFADRASTVQGSYADMPVTSAAQAIHSQYIGNPLKLIMPSVGMISMSSSAGGLPVGSIKPFAAIKSVLDRANYGSVKTGASMYFENDHGQTVMGPLEQIFANETANPGVTLEQRETWGSSWQHMFGADNASNAIIQIKLYKKESDKGGAGSATMAQNIVKNTVDIGLNQFSLGIPAISSALSGLSSIASSIGGGIALTQALNTNRTSQASDPTQKSAAESAYVAAVKDSPNYLVKIGMQSGFRLSVGEGVKIKIPNPRAVQLNQVGEINMNLLVADMMHECYFDSRDVAATSVLRLVAPV